MKIKIFSFIVIFNIINAADIKTAQECFYKSPSPKSPKSLLYDYQANKSDLYSRFVQASNIFSGHDNLRNKFNAARNILTSILDSKNPSGFSESEYKNLIYNTKLLLGKIYFIGDDSEPRNLKAAQYYFEQLKFNIIPENIRILAYYYIDQIQGCLKDLNCISV